MFTTRQENREEEIHKRFGEFVRFIKFVFP